MYSSFCSGRREHYGLDVTLHLLDDMGKAGCEISNFKNASNLYTLYNTKCKDFLNNLKAANGETEKKHAEQTLLVEATSKELECLEKLSKLKILFSEWLLAHTNETNYSQWVQSVEETLAKAKMNQTVQNEKLRHYTRSRLQLLLKSSNAAREYWELKVNIWKLKKQKKALILKERKRSNQWPLHPKDKEFIISLAELWVAARDRQRSREAAESAAKLQASLTDQQPSVVNDSTGQGHQQEENCNLLNDTHISEQLEQFTEEEQCGKNPDDLELDKNLSNPELENPETLPGISENEKNPQNVDTQTTIEEIININLCSLDNEGLSQREEGKGNTPYHVNEVMVTEILGEGKTNALQSLVEVQQPLESMEILDCHPTEKKPEEHPEKPEEHPEEPIIVETVKNPTEEPENVSKYFHRQESAVKATISNKSLEIESYSIPATPKAPQVSLVAKILNEDFIFKIPAPLPERPKPLPVTQPDPKTPVATYPTNEQQHIALKNWPRTPFAGIYNTPARSRKLTKKDQRRALDAVLLTSPLPSPKNRPVPLASPLLSPKTPPRTSGFSDFADDHQSDVQRTPDARFVPDEEGSPGIFSLVNTRQIFSEKNVPPSPLIRLKQDSGMRRDDLTAKANPVVGHGAFQLPWDSLNPRPESSAGSNLEAAKSTGFSDKKQHTATAFAVLETPKISTLSVTEEAPRHGIWQMKLQRAAAFATVEQQKSAEFSGHSAAKESSRHEDWEIKQQTAATLAALDTPKSVKFSVNSAAKERPGQEFWDTKQQTATTLATVEQQKSAKYSAHSAAEEAPREEFSDTKQQTAAAFVTVEQEKSGKSSAHAAAKEAPGQGYCDMKQQTAAAFASAETRKSDKFSAHSAAKEPTTEGFWDMKQQTEPLKITKLPAHSAAKEPHKQENWDMKQQTAGASICVEQPKSANFSAHSAAKEPPRKGFWDTKQQIAAASASVETRKNEKFSVHSATKELPRTSASATRGPCAGESSGKASMPSSVQEEPLYPISIFNTPKIPKRPKPVIEPSPEVFFLEEKRKSPFFNHDVFGAGYVKGEHSFFDLPSGSQQGSLDRPSNFSFKSYSSTGGSPNNRPDSDFFSSPASTDHGKDPKKSRSEFPNEFMELLG